jgi:hypothetical protein
MAALPLRPRDYRSFLLLLDSKERLGSGTWDMSSPAVSWEERRLRGTTQKCRDVPISCDKRWPMNHKRQCRGEDLAEKNPSFFIASVEYSMVVFQNFLFV